MTQPPIRLSLFGLINVYLVPEKDGLTLIDTAMPPLVPQIVKKAAQIGQPIRRVLLTHGHPDHIGGLDGVLDAFPQAEVWLNAADAHYLSETGLKARATHDLHEGQRIGSLQVIAAPGHSAGQVAFLDERDGTLYAADAFTSVGQLRVVTELNPLMPMATFGTADPATARATGAKLAALPGLNWLALGHGKPVPQPGPALRAAVARDAQQLPVPAWQMALARQINALLSPSPKSKDVSSG